MAGSTDDELIDALPDAVIAVDAQRRIVAWNRAAEAAYGFSRAEAIGRPAPELLRSRFPAPLAEILETLADTGSWEGAVVHIGRDGCEIAVDSRWSARRDEDGRSIGALWVDREHMSPAADDTRAQAQSPHELERLGRLASSVAHDFNNLLAVIVNYSALIGQALEAAHHSTGDERWAIMRSDVGEIRLAAERATHLSRQLLAATRGDDHSEVELIGSPAEPELPASRRG